MDDSPGRVAPIDPALPPETDERARELRAEIVETRAEMSETIEEIQERLSPSNIVANAKDSVRNATTEKVKAMANTAGDAADRVMNNRFMDTVRANPIPAAMIGFGAAWLLIKGRTESRPYTDGGRDWRGENEHRTSEYGDPYDWRTRTGTPSYRYGASEIAAESDSSGRISGMASDAATRAADAAADVREAVEELTEDGGEAPAGPRSEVSSSANVADARTDAPPIPSRPVVEPNRTTRFPGPGAAARVRWRSWSTPMAITLTSGLPW